MTWRNQAACMVAVILMSGCASKQSTEEVEEAKSEPESTISTKSIAPATDSISQLMQSGALNSNEATDKAIKKITGEIKKNPSDPDLLFKRGFLYRSRAAAVSTRLNTSRSENIGIYEKSVKDFTSVIELRPKYYSAYRWRAETFVSLDKLDDAMADTNKLLKLKPDSRAPHDLKVKIYSQRKQFDKALKEVNIAIAKCEKEPNVKAIAFNYMDRALIYQNLGEFDKGEKDYNKVITLLEPLKDRGSKTLLGGAYASLSSFYLKQKKYKQVITQSKKAIEISGDLAAPFAYINMGEAYSALGDHKKAASTFEDAIKSYDNYQKAYLLCSKEYKKLGKSKKASEYLAKYEELKNQGKATPADAKGNK